MVMLGALKFDLRTQVMWPYFFTLCLYFGNIVYQNTLKLNKKKNYHS